jgi:hypothetical protein
VRCDDDIALTNKYTFFHCDFDVTKVISYVVLCMNVIIVVNSNVREIHSSVEVLAGLMYISL